jgi:hypothetical protein
MENFFPFTRLEWRRFQCQLSLASISGHGVQWRVGSREWGVGHLQLKTSPLPIPYPPLPMVFTFLCA